MTDATSACNDDHLRVLLHDNEDSAEYKIAAEHLESCESCQLRLSELAADHDEWAEAKRSLAINAADEHIVREQGERSWYATGKRRPPTGWNDSMARQLLSPPSHPEMLGRLGRYEIERLIGIGGMGVVFKGFDSELNRPVAIKVLAPHLAGSGAARKRFAREARAAAAIVHEHVVAIHNVESDSEPPFLVMQYIAGESLQGRLDREGPLTVCEVLRIARQTAAGLAAAHEQGLVHRDVKPSNILLEQGVERALLTDFGLARAGDDASLTHSGHLPGTPHYMSTEQARGDRVDHRSDLFSLGSVMYAMCTGRPPFRAETSYGILRRITDTEPRPIREVNPEIPLWLCCVIEKLNAKSPSDRFESAEEVTEMLSQCLAHVQQPDTQPLPKSLAQVSAKQQAKLALAEGSEMNEIERSLGAEVRAPLNAHLNSVEQVLVDAGVPRSERRSICDQLEAQACEMVWQRAEGEPTEQHMRMVLAELDYPEAYREAVEPSRQVSAERAHFAGPKTHPYSLWATPIPRALATIGATVLVEATVLLTRNASRQMIEDFELDVSAVIHFVFGPIFPVLLAIPILVALVKAVVPRFLHAANAWNVLIVVVAAGALCFYVFAMFSLGLEMLMLRGPH